MFEVYIGKYDQPLRTLSTFENSFQVMLFFFFFTGKIDKNPLFRIY